VKKPIGRVWMIGKPKPEGYKNTLEIDHPED